MNRLPGIITNLLLCLILVSALAGCGNHETTSRAAERPREFPVKIFAVQEQVVDDASNFLGVLKSRRSVTLKPRVEGQISNIFVQSGAVVAQGTPILQVDPEKQVASVNMSMANVESNQAEKENMLQTLKSLMATREARLSNVQFARQQCDRYQGLQRQGAVSQEAVDQYRNNCRAAEADLQAIDAQISAQNAVISRTEKVLKQARSSTKQEQVQLAYYKITAPFNGIVGDIPVKVGDFVNTSTALTTIDQLKPLELYVYIPADQSSRLHVGTQIDLLDSSQAVIGHCSVFFISPEVRNENQSVLVKANFDNAAGQLRCNQEINARVIWTRGARVLVPTTAVAHLSGQDFVFVVENQGNSAFVVHQRPVKLGDISQNAFIVKSGLHAGEKVVISDVENLVDGMPVVPKQ